MGSGMEKLHLIEFLIVLCLASWLRVWISFLKIGCAEATLGKL